MTSKLKSDTARANGAKSRGPKTPATRQKSSQNSLQHGFTSRNTLLLACEDPDLYQRVRTEYIATYQPATPVESDLVDEMVASHWRILRIRVIETALIDSELLNQAANIRRQVPGADAGIQLALAFRSLPLRVPPPSHPMSLSSNPPRIAASTKSRVRSRRNPVPRTC